MKNRKVVEGLEWGVEAVYPHIHREKASEIAGGVIRVGWDCTRKSFSAEVWVLEEPTGEMVLWATRGQERAKLPTIDSLKDALRPYGELTVGLLEELQKEERSTRRRSVRKRAVWTQRAVA